MSFRSEDCAKYFRDAHRIRHVIRIACIDAPEKGQAFGDASRRSLSSLAINRIAHARCHKTDRYRRERRWGELVANVAPADGQAHWLDELVAVLRKAAAGNVVRPITASIDCAQGGRVVRPVLLEMEHNGDGGEFCFHLIFLEEFSTPAGRSVPPRVRTLLAAVRMHNRVRWEVLERFTGASWSAEEREACAKALSRIDREWRAQGEFDTRALREHYAEAATDEVVELFEDWLDLLASPSGPLPRALSGQDATQVRDALIRCRALNQRFFEITFPVLESLTRG